MATTYRVRDNKAGRYLKHPKLPGLFRVYELFHSSELKGLGLEEGWYWDESKSGKLPIGPFESDYHAMVDMKKATKDIGTLIES